MALKSGDLVDRYRIVAPLGAGGMGEVFHAFDTKLQRNVALKLLHADKDAPDSGSPNMSHGVARMLREARAAAALEHPNVISIYDVGEVQEPAELRGSAFLAMELIKGNSLRAFTGDLSIPLTERIRWLTDIAKALSTAHEQGLVHRDVKPENVMLRRDGVIKVLDFGIAKRSYGSVDPAQSTEAHILPVPSVTAQGMAIGTPYYMAPEQMRGDALDGRADQFSWGVMAYELLCGKGPWRTDADALGLVAEVLSKPVESPCVLNPEVPAHVGRAVVKALTKSREGRFASMVELIEELQGGAVEPSAPVPSPRVSAHDLAEIGSAKTEFVPSAREAKTAPSKAPPPMPPEPTPPPTPPPASNRRWLAVGGAGALIALVAGGLALSRTSAPIVLAPTEDAGAKIAACVSNVECSKAHEGAAYRCRHDDGVCAPLASDDCKVFAEKADLENDETVWIGTMYPLTGPSAATFGKAFSKGVDLAREDFAQTMSGIVAKSGKVRPIGIIACDDAADADRAARHLVDDVKVPAVIGFRSGIEFVELAKSRFLPARIAMIASLSTNPLVTAMPQPAGSARLTWRTTSDITQMAAPIGLLVSELLEPQIRSQRGREQGTRVALLAFKSPAQLAFADTLLGELRFNGKTAIENGPDYRPFTVDGLAADAKPDYDGVASALAAFAPDVIIYYGGEQLVNHVLAPLEAKWPAAGKHRPIYIDPTTFSDAAMTFVGKNAERRHRFFGFGPMSNTPANARLVMHYNEAFPDKISRALCPNTDYDAFYMLAYATYALGDKPVTGPSLAQAFARLQPPGKSIDVGPTHIFEAFNALERGENINLNGATGSLDFDLATGEAPVDQAVFCVNVDDKGNATEGIESGVVYNTTTKKLEGKLRCP